MCSQCAELESCRLRKQKSILEIIGKKNKLEEQVYDLKEDE